MKKQLEYYILPFHGATNYILSLALSGVTALLWSHFKIERRLVSFLYSQNAALFRFQKFWLFLKLSFLCYANFETDWKSRWFQHSFMNYYLSFCRNSLFESKYIKTRIKNLIDEIFSNFSLETLSLWWPSSVMRIPTLFPVLKDDFWPT